MKNGIVKIWVCKGCEKEFLDRPIVCTKCDGFEFDVKYGGQIHDAEELTKLIERYKNTEPDESRFKSKEKVIKKDKPEEKAPDTDTGKEKKVRL